jgi:excisionase family DNA binding protein
MIQLMKEQELAHLLAIGPATVRKLRYQGLIPFVKVGGAVRYHPVQISEWLERSSVSSTGTKQPVRRSLFAFGR